MQEAILPTREERGQTGIQLPASSRALCMHSAARTHPEIAPSSKPGAGVISARDESERGHMEMSRQAHMDRKCFYSCLKLFS